MRCIIQYASENSAHIHTNEANKSKDVRFLLVKTTISAYQMYARGLFQNGTDIVVLHSEIVTIAQETHK